MSEKAMRLPILPRVQKKAPSIGIYLIVTLILTVVVFVIAKLQYQKSPELELAQRSALSASLCAVPIFWMILREPRSLLERCLIGVWWPLKIAVTFYYYFIIWDASNNPEMYLRYSDHLPWHELAVRVASYWAQYGVGLIPKEILVQMSLNYPAAGYFFGIIYYCFGPFLSTTMPWLSLVVLLSASLGQKLMEQCGLPTREARVALQLLLWSPFIWLLTMLVHRDPLVIFCWLAIAYSALRTFQHVSLMNFCTLGAASIVLVNLRPEYLYVEMAWLIFLALFTFHKKLQGQPFVRIALLGTTLVLLFFIGLSIWGGYSSWYVAKYDIGSSIEKQIDIYWQMGGKGLGLYGKVLSLGYGIFFPLIIPFKFLIGLTAPFPWRFSSFELSVTQPFYSAESLLRFTLLYFSFWTILRWRSFGRQWSIEVKLMLILGVLVMVAGLVGPTSEVRYIAPAIPLLVPAFADSASRPVSWIMGMVFAASAIALLHLFYAIFRGGI